jgi:heat shock protein HslJ
MRLLLASGTTGLIQCLAITLLAACSAPPPKTTSATPPASTDADELNRPTILGAWHVVAIEATDGTREPLIPPGRPTLEFSRSDSGPGRLSGDGGVNRFGGPFEFSLGERNVGVLKIRDLAATRRAGPEDAMRFEEALLAALQAARTVTINGSDAVIDTGRDRVRMIRENANR